MLDRIFVTRKNYNHDVEDLRRVIAELTKSLRAEENEKHLARQDAKNLRLEGKLLRNEIERLIEKTRQSTKERDFKDYLNPIPAGETARAQYMAQVSGHFQGGLKDKLNYMLSQFKNQTGMFPLTERETDFFRACINVVGLLLDWGEESVAEHHANIAKAKGFDEESAFDEHPEEKQSVENIKSKLKE